MLSETEMLSTPDASVWAKEFVARFGLMDEGLMLSWFANAMTAAEMPLSKEVRRLRQGLWDVYKELGYDTDGDPSPDALEHPDIVQLVVNAAYSIMEELRNED